MTHRTMPLRMKRAQSTTFRSVAAGLTAAMLTAAIAGAARDARADEEPPPKPLARPKGEVIGALGATAGSSTWPGDPVAMSTLKLGYRFYDWIAPYYLGRLGYGPVNDRSLLTLSFGVQAWGRLGSTRPYARVSVLHQHEETLSAIRQDTGGALFGVGDGIRHRYGGELGVGIELPIHRNKSAEFVVALETVADYLPDPRGPTWYVLGGASLGVNYSLY